MGKSTLVILWLLIASTGLAQRFERPFASNSYWNTPIQDGADIVASGVNKTTWFLVFEEYVVDESLLSGTLRNVRNKTSVDYCISNIDATIHYTMRIPDSYTNTTKGSGNGISTWVETDNATQPGRIREGYMWQRCAASGDIAQQFAGNHGNGIPANVDGFNIYSRGRTNVPSAVGAWEAGTLGGIIREGELTTPAGVFPKHTLRIVLSGEFLYNPGSRGWRWPAYNEDGWFTYTGTDPNTRMGSVLTMERGTSPASLGIVTEPGKKIFWMIYYYGAYPVDSFNNPDSWGIGGPVIQKRHSGVGGNTVEDEVRSMYGIDLDDAGSGGFDNQQTADFHNDVDLIFSNLKVLSNSSSKWPKGPPTGSKVRMKKAGTWPHRGVTASLEPKGGYFNLTQE